MKPLIGLALILLLFPIQTRGATPLNNMPPEGDRPWWDRWFRDQNRNLLDDQLELLSSQYADVLIDFQEEPSSESIGEVARISSLAGGRLSAAYRHINTVAVEHIHRDSLDSLLRIPGVVMVEMDSYGHGALDISTRAIKARAGSYSPNTTWSLGWIIFMGSPAYIWSGFTGLGINIGIIDTGVDDEHVSLSGKFIAGFNAIWFQDCNNNGLDDDTPGEPGGGCPDGNLEPANGSTNPNDDNTVGCGTYHGTHVAAEALAGPFVTPGPTVNDSFLGVAPRAKLIDIKALDGSCSFSSSDMIEAIEWATTNKNTAWPGAPAENQGIDILSISACTFAASDGSDALSQSVNAAVAAGIVVVAAMCNTGPSNTGFGSPAAADDAIAVANVDDMNTVNRTDDSIYSTSSRGPRTSDGDSDQIDELKPDVAAYGANIMAARGGNPASNLFFEKTGTSMSTPHVASVVALMLESRPELNPTEVKEILRMTAEDRSSGSCPTYNPSLSTKYDLCHGWGIADAWRAAHELGHLNITLGASSPADHVWSPPDLYDEVLQLNLTVGETEQIELRSMAVQASGTGDDASDILNITIVQDDNSNGIYDQNEIVLSYGTANYDQDDGNATILFGDGIHGAVPPLGTTHILVIYRYDAGRAGIDGKTYRLDVTAIDAAGAITLQSPNITGLPVPSATITIDIPPTAIPPISLFVSLPVAAVVIIQRRRKQFDENRAKAAVSTIGS